ncbi:MAG TPA: hypothetical protein VMV44_01590, partial [Rectinemataceae bacterium]|nr:hypothetical protein [Rectinemataceae bacterium]
VAITGRQSVNIVRILLSSGAKIDFPFPGTWGKTIIDYALADSQYQSASLLLQINATLPAKSRQAIDKRYDSRVVLLTDDVDKAKSIIASGEFAQKEMWRMALAGNSKKTLQILVKLYDTPEIESDDLRLVVSNSDLLDYLLSIGFVLTDQQIQTAGIYEYLIQQRNLSVVTKVRSMDLSPHPELYNTALEAGIDYLSAVTRSFADLTAVDLYDSGLAGNVFDKTDEVTALALIANCRPNSEQLLSLYASKPQLFVAVVNGDSSGLYSLKDVAQGDRTRTWQVAINNNDTKGMAALAKIDPAVSPQIGAKLLQSDPDLLTQLIAAGLKLSGTDDLWYAALSQNRLAIFPILLKISNPPSNIVVRATQMGDQALYALLNSGCQITPSAIDWDSLIKRNFTSSLEFLQKAGFRPAAGAILTALAYNQAFFLSLPKEQRQLTREQLGQTTMDYAVGGRSVTRLALEIAIDNGFTDSLIALDKDFKIFDRDPNSQDPAAYPSAGGDRPRGRKSLKYFAVIVGHTAGSTRDDYLWGEKAQRGYGPDGYNDFLSNNFNVLSFLIAVKYDQKALAQYILGRDPSIKSASVFSGDESRGLGVYRFNVTDFVSKMYKNTSYGALLRGGT